MNSNPQGAKERVLQVWPDATCIQTVADSQHKSYCWIHRGDNNIAAHEERIGQGCDEASAWSDAATRLPTSGAPVAPPSAEPQKIAIQLQRTRDHEGNLLSVAPPVAHEVHPTAIELLADVMNLWIDGYISKNPNSSADDSISSGVFDKVLRFLEAQGIEVDYCGWHRNASEEVHMTANPTVLGTCDFTTKPHAQGFHQPRCTNFKPQAEPLRESQPDLNMRVGFFDLPGKQPPTLEQDKCPSCNVDRRKPAPRLCYAPQQHADYVPKPSGVEDDGPLSVCANCGMPKCDCGVEGEGAICAACKLTYAQHMHDPENHGHEFTLVPLPEAGGERTQNELDLTMLVKRLLRKIEKHTPDDPIIAQANDFLQRKQLVRVADIFR